jgi:hypothetical protein
MRHSPLTSDALLPIRLPLRCPSSMPSPCPLRSCHAALRCQCTLSDTYLPLSHHARRAHMRHSPLDPSAPHTGGAALLPSLTPRVVYSDVRPRCTLTELTHETHYISFVFTHIQLIYRSNTSRSVMSSRAIHCKASRSLISAIPHESLILGSSLLVSSVSLLFVGCMIPRLVCRGSPASMASLQCPLGSVRARRSESCAG